jgi:hypothetical protein
MQRIQRLGLAAGLALGLSACGGASMSVDDDPGTGEPDFGVSAGADLTEGELNADIDVGDDDD